MKIEFCPRCGTKRPDELQWCRKCGLDFHKAERGEAPAVARREPPGGWAVDRVQPPEPQTAWQQPFIPHVDVRPRLDRRTMAQMSGDAMTVRCLGTIGGMVGAFLGFILFAILGGAIGGAGALLAFVGIPIGFFVGARFALALMAR